MPEIRPPVENAELDAALRTGLREVPVPEVSPAFDAAVLAAVDRSLAQPWSPWSALRSALAGAITCMAVGMALVHWISAAPLADQPGPPAAGARSLAVEAGLGEPGLHAGALVGLASPAPVAQVRAREIPGRGDGPRARYEEGGPACRQAA